MYYEMYNLWMIRYSFIPVFFLHDAWPFEIHFARYLTSNSILCESEVVTNWLPALWQTVQMHLWAVCSLAIVSYN